MQTFNIDIAQSPAPLVLYAKQGDSLSRFFQINFLESGRPWTPPAGALFAVRYGVPGLPSGWYDTITEPDGSSHSAFGLLGNALTVEIAHEAVSVSGRNTLCVLVLDSNGYQLGAWNLALQVEITPGENAPESTQYYSLLSAQVAQVLAAVTDAENAATLSKSWAVGGTGTREGEDTNNAEYWAGQAAASAGQSLGFRTFSAAVSPDPTTGDVDPTSPMLMANLTATSAADRLDHVVIPGKTVQAGSGDPSPANVRALSGVGRKMVALPVTSSMSWTYVKTSGGADRFEAQVDCPWPVASTSDNAKTSQFCNELVIDNIDNVPGGSCIYIRNGDAAPTTSPVLRMGVAGISSVATLKQHLDENDVILYYVPEDESQATGWYTYATVGGDIYAAVGLPLNGPLYDGDKVSNDEPSGCDTAVTVDGSSDESWGLASGDTSVQFLSIDVAKYKVSTTTTIHSFCDGLFRSDVMDSDNPAANPTKLGSFSMYTGTNKQAVIKVKMGVSTIEDLRQRLAEKPLTFIFAGPNYAQQNDKPISKEAHESVFFELDGVTRGLRFTSAYDTQAQTTEFRLDESPRVSGSDAVKACTTFKPVGTTWGNDTPYICGIGGTSTDKVISVRLPNSVATTVEQANQWLEDQKAVGKTACVLAKRATPAVYAHPAQPLKNPEGEWTLSAENTPQGYMRALSDANRADYAEQAKQADKLGGHLPAWYAPPGAVIPYAGSSAPDGWLLCDGRTVSRTTYAALFAVIGTTYGAGNGSTTFALPDLRGRVAAGANASNALASKAGADSKQITRANLPAEKLKIADNGSWLVDTTQFGVHTGKPLTLGAGRIDAEYLYTDPLGSGTAFDVRQATLYLNYIIKY